MVELSSAVDLSRLRNTGSAGILIKTQWCNIFGGENDGGAKAVLGGIGPQQPDRQWYCPIPAIGRYQMFCEHGHKGQIMHLCGKHFRQFRADVTFCPACNSNPPGHKCSLTLEGLS